VSQRERERERERAEKGRERGQQQPLRYRYKFHDRQAGVVHAFTASSFYASLVLCVCELVFLHLPCSKHSHTQERAVEHSKQQQRK